jgi:hypothetical protein
MFVQGGVVQVVDQLFAWYPRQSYASIPSAPQGEVEGHGFRGFREIGARRRQGQVPVS